MSATNPRWLAAAMFATIAISIGGAWCVVHREGDRGGSAATSASPTISAPLLDPAPQPGDAWSAAPLPAAAHLHAIESGEDALFAVGDQGTIVLRQRAEDVWHIEPSNVTAALRALSVRGDELVAVGDGGVITGRRGGAPFAARASGTTKHLRGVRHSSLGLIVVGDGGTVLREDASGGFHLEKSGTTQNLRGVCASLIDAWIVGDGGTLLHLTLLGVEAVRSGTSEDLRAIACDGSSFVAVGSHGTIVERRDGGAPVVTHDGDAEWLAVAAYPGTKSFIAVGRERAISSAYAARRSGLQGDLEGVVQSSLGTWAVGSAGVFTAR